MKKFSFVISTDYAGETSYPPRWIDEQPIFCPHILVSNRTEREKIRRWLYSRSDIIFNKFHCLQFSGVSNFCEWFTWHIQVYHFDFVRVYCHQCNSQFSQKKPERKWAHSNLNNLHANNRLTFLLPLALALILSQFSPCHTQIIKCMKPLRLQ